MRRDAPQRLEWHDPPLAELDLPSGRMALTRSLTSGLVARSGDPPGVFWGIGDRGPNIKPAQAIERYGLTSLAPLADIDGVKIMPLPDAGPSLARFRMTDNAISLDAVIPLRTPDGTLLDGLPPAADFGAECEPVFALDGKPLGASSIGADTEGIAALGDGRFCIAEEYGPSLLIVGDDGVVQRRIVPKGAGALFAEGDVPVDEALPAIARARKLNRGFEAVALSHDGAALFVAFQSPLAHPDREAHCAADVIRIWALDPETFACIGEYAYPLDAPGAFRRDSAVGAVNQSDVKVSELVSLSDGSLLVLERVTLSTHIYRVQPGKSWLASHFLDPDHRPTLEQMGCRRLHAAHQPVLDKQLILSTDDLPMICGDLEGMLLLQDGGLLLVNDSDYGVEGAVTEFWRVPASLMLPAIV